METKPRTKEEIRAAAEALFKDFDAEFGKKTKKAPAVKPAPKPAPESEFSEANRITLLMGSNSPWKPVSVVAHLVTQVCKCCRGETEFLGNTLIRHEHKTKGYTWDHVIPASPEHTALPHTLEEHTITVEQCPSCIRLEFKSCSVSVTARQLSLFH